MYRVALYASPGYMDLWSVRYWLYRVTVALRKASRWTQVYVLGSGGALAAEHFCRSHKYTLVSWPAPDPAHLERDLEILKEDVNPDVLLIFTRGGEIGWDFATMAIERGLETVLTANVSN